MKQIKPVKIIKLTKEEQAKENELYAKHGLEELDKSPGPERDKANINFNIDMLIEVVIPRIIKAIQNKNIGWVDIAAALENLKKEKKLFAPKFNFEEYKEELECIDFEIQLCREELNRRDLHWLDRKAYKRRLKAAIERREYVERCGIKHDDEPVKEKKEEPNKNLIETPWKI